MNWKEKYLNKVVQGDCLDVMKELPDKCIDLVLTDPPYGIGAGKMTMGKGKNLKVSGDDWDRFVPTQDCFDEVFRISRNQIIWGGNYFDLPLSRCFLIWDKNNAGRDFAECEQAWVSIDGVARMFKWRPQGMDGGKQHPTQKPVELMVWCLENYLLKNWKEDRRPIVFDGFAGSGTTAVACKKCGVDYILVEKEADYVEICNKRLAQETLF